MVDDHVIMKHYGSYVSYVYGDENLEDACNKHGFIKGPIVPCKLTAKTGKELIAE